MIGKIFVVVFLEIILFRFELKYEADRKLNLDMKEDLKKKAKDIIFLSLF